MIDTLREASRARARARDRPQPPRPCVARICRVHASSAEQRRHARGCRQRDARRRVTARESAEGDTCLCTREAPASCRSSACSTPSARAQPSSSRSGYLDFLSLLDNARLVLTDSGGIQEETTVLGVPCLTFRENTERPITVTNGTNRVVGLDPRACGACGRRHHGRPRVHATHP